MSFIDDIKRQGVPVTIGIISLAIVGFMSSYFRLNTLPYLALSTETIAERPWTLLTYPFAGDGFAAGLALIFFVLGLMWTWWFGAPIERELGSQRYLLFFLAITLIGGLSLLVGGAVFAAPVAIWGIFIPMSAVTVAWAYRNKGATVMFMGFIPMDWKVLSIVTAGMLFLNIGSMFGSPFLGVFAMVPLLVAYLYAANRLPIQWGYAGGFGNGSKVREQNLKRTERQNKAYYEDVRRREQERAERERLRQLFEKSMIDDPDAEK